GGGHDARPEARAGGRMKDEPGISRPGLLRFPIQDPSPYYSQGDENRFYRGLYALPEFVDVKWDGSALQLTLQPPLGRESFRELVALFRRYQLPLGILKPAAEVLSKADRKHFMRPDAFYFDELFGGLEKASR